MDGRNKEQGRWTDGWTDGRTDGRTDRWMDGWMAKVKEYTVQK